MTEEADSALWWKYWNTPYLYHSPSLNNFEQKIQELSVGRGINPCRTDLFIPGCARHWGSPLLPETILLSIWVQQEIMHTAHTLFHLKVLRAAGPSRNHEKPCYSPHYSLENSQVWGGSVLAPLPLDLTKSFQGREPLPKKQLQPAPSDHFDWENPLRGVWRERWSFHSLTECSSTFYSLRGRGCVQVPIVSVCPANLARDLPWTWTCEQRVTAEGLTTAWCKLLYV